VLDRRAVRAVLEEIGLPVRGCLHGFELGRNDDDGTARLETGSGIAGRSGAWKLVRIGPRYRPGQVIATPAVTTRAALRRLLREYMAGLDEKPPERPGYRTLATRNHNRFGEHWVWVQQRCPGPDTGGE